MASPPASPSRSPTGSAAARAFSRQTPTGGGAFRVQRSDRRLRLLLRWHVRRTAEAEQTHRLGDAPHRTAGSELFSEPAFHEELPVRRRSSARPHDTGLSQRCVHLEDTDRELHSHAARGHSTLLDAVARPRRISQAGLTHSRQASLRQRQPATVRHVADRSRSTASPSSNVNHSVAGVQRSRHLVERGHPVHSQQFAMRARSKLSTRVDERSGPSHAALDTSPRHRPGVLHHRPPRPCTHQRLCTDVLTARFADRFAGQRNRSVRPPASGRNYRLRPVGWGLRGDPVSVAGCELGDVLSLALGVERRH